LGDVGCCVDNVVVLVLCSSICDGCFIHNESLIGFRLLNRSDGHIEMPKMRRELENQVFSEYHPEIYHKIMPKLRS
jgi:hypothetical protein